MNLCLFTANYPFGKSESFIANEIKILSLKFDNIFIFPSKVSGEMRKVPVNVEVVFIKDSYIRNHVLKYDLSLLINNILREIIRKPMFRNNIKETLSYFSRLIFKSYKVEEWILNNNNNNIYYSYWFDEWATVLSILKYKRIIPKFVSRVHGFDLYDYRLKSGKIKFRKFQLENVKKLYPVSHDGKSFLKKTYPVFSEKIMVSYLGTKDYGKALYKPTTTLKILSISNLYPLKRINLLVEALKHVKINVEWKHFGEGFLLKYIKELVNSLDNNIKCEFLGQKTNEFLMSYIKNNHFDVFINLSKFEGLPVSIIEAISFGVPVFATDAGGSREAVNYRTGKLFKNNFKTEDLSESLNNFFQSEYSQLTFRDGVRDFWLKNFDAKKIYEEFVVELKSN